MACLELELAIILLFLYKHNILLVKMQGVINIQAGNLDL
jgi:hypothetical protein